MNVQFYDIGGGTTVITAEAMVSWQPPRLVQGNELDEFQRTPATRARSSLVASSLPGATV